MNKRLLAYFSLSLSMILVGTAVVVGKVMSASLPIFLATFLSLLVASLLFAPVFIPLIRHRTLSKSDYWYLGLSALFGTVLYRIFLFIGLQYIDASFASIIMALQPAIITVLAVGLLHEKPTRNEIIGVSLAVAGLIIAYLGSGISIALSQSFLLGTFFVLLSVIGGASFSIFAKKVDKKVKPLEVAAMVTLLSCLLSVPTAIYDSLTFDISSVTLTGIGMILYYGVVLTCVTFILWFYGLKQVKASAAGIFTALVPVSGVFFSMVLLHESPTSMQFVGGTCVLASIMLIIYHHEK